MSGKIGNFFWLTEEQMERPRPKIFSKSYWVPRIDDRQVTCGIVFINRNRLRLPDAPAEHGPPKKLYTR